MRGRSFSRFKCNVASLSVVMIALICSVSAPVVLGDGVMVPPKPVKYAGSVEETAQEAIIIFHGSTKPGGAVEDLILKISVEGNVKRFGWVIPFPNEPKATREDARLFKELFNYVGARLQGRKRGKLGAKHSGAEAAVPAAKPVEVLSRKTVGSYDVAVVRENVKGALNGWLEQEGFRTLGDAEDVIGFYRKKGYVFACIRVSDAVLTKDKPVELHPLRFTFKTGGRDGIFFPMKMTGLQKARFDVNLYVFYHAWLNDKLSRYGYVHRGFALKYRDWDSPACKPNAGKAWSAPETDPFLKAHAHRLPAVIKLFQKLHPGEKYYLTNIQAGNLRPDDVRNWVDDLWLFPYYVNRRFVPYDARPGGPASSAWVKAER